MSEQTAVRLLDVPRQVLEFDDKVANHLPMNYFRHRNPSAAGSQKDAHRTSGAVPQHLLGRPNIRVDNDNSWHLKSIGSPNQQ